MKNTIVKNVFIFLIKAIHGNVFPINQEENKKDGFEKKALRWIRMEFVRGMQMRFQNSGTHQTVLVWRCYEAFANVAFPVDKYFHLSEVGIYVQREIIPLERYFDDDKDGQAKIEAVRRDLEKIKNMFLCLTLETQEYFK